nr:mucin-7 [Vicugna pacos]
MKTLPLLLCICALSACFSLSEGQKQQREILHKKNNLRLYIVDHGLPFYPKLPPYWNPFIQKQSPFSQSRRRKIRKPRGRKPTRPKPSLPPNSPIENNTVVNNNTSEATTQIPPVTPPPTKISPPPSVTSPAQKTPTTFARDDSSPTGSSAAVATPHFPASPEDTAVPPTASPTTPAPPITPVPEETTAAPNTTPTPSLTTVTPEIPKTTAAPTTQTTALDPNKITTAEDTTSSAVKKIFPEFFLTLSKLWEQIFNIVTKN